LSLPERLDTPLITIGPSPGLGAQAAVVVVLADRCAIRNRFAGSHARLCHGRRGSARWTRCGAHP
jgi:hypothetical protein